MKISLNDVKEIKALHKQGLSERAIAKKVGCSRTTVWNHLNKDKIKNNKNGR